MILKLLFAVMVIGFATPAIAQDGNAPVEITADKTLEWHKNALQYVARGNAVVKRGDVTIKSDLMTADYRAKSDRKQGSNTDIYRMTGTGNVSIDNKGSIVTGDKVVYDIDAGIATMTGENLSMTSPDQIVTASESFQYTIKDGRVKAIGNAKLVRGNNTLQGDTIDAILSTGTDGKNSLDRLEAHGNVKIVTPAEILTGSNATYNAKANNAVVTGNVKIMRGQNVLTGGRAEIDLTTNVSRLFGSSIEDGQTGGRVRGVFYPGSEGQKP